jgi:hypothetical protein
MMNNLIKLYVRLVTTHGYTLDQVPTLLRAGVEKQIAEEKAKAETESQEAAAKSE